MRSDRDVAIAAARAGADVVATAARTREFTVRTKSRADYVTEVDTAAEQAVLAVLRSERPDDALLSEEASGPGELVGAGRTWVADPLDGTTNFIRGIPFFAVAVGLEVDGRPVAGAIVDPLRGDTWSGADGEGAWRDAERMAVSPRADLGEALVLTGIPFRDLRPLERYLGELERIARTTAGIRRMGSAALDLCSVAEGRAEAFWEHGLGRWDLTAGVAIVLAAGGRASDLGGGPTHLESGDVLVSNGHVHAALLALIVPS